MKYQLATDPAYDPPQLVKSSRYNPRYFSLAALNTSQCLRLMQKMQQNAPGLYSLIHEDPFAKMLVTEFNADIIIPMREKK